MAGDDLVCLVVDGDRARGVLGSAGGVAFVQASLRRGVLQSLDRETGSLVATSRAPKIERQPSPPLGSNLACTLLDDGADAVKIGRVIGSSIDALTGRLLAFAIDDVSVRPGSLGVDGPRERGQARAGPPHGSRIAPSPTSSAAVRQRRWIRISPNSPSS